MSVSFDEMLRPMVREPGSWFGCGRELSFLLPSLGDDVIAEFGACTRDHSHPTTKLMATIRAFLLLAGSAAENYVKGLWLAEERASQRRLSHPETEKFLPDRLTGHNLVALAREASVSLDSKQTATLELLARSVVWYARYPAPKQADQFELFGSGPHTIQEIMSLIASFEQLARMKEHGLAQA